MTAQVPSSAVASADEDSSLVAGRYFFHLTNGHDTLADDTGIEATSIREAKTQALNAIEELRTEDALAADDWEGWRLEVADRFGTVVFAITLVGSLVEPYPKPRTASGRWLCN